MKDEMRRCKECGKLFKPKGREQYCSDVHYRPCPSCGALVEAKYLSDPPRRCADCRLKNKMSRSVRPLFELPNEVKEDIIESVQDSSEQVEIINTDIPIGKDIRKFIGKDYRRGKGFIPNHLYEITISKDEYSYWITASYDWTSNKEVSITELFSSIISIDSHFEKMSTT